MLKFFRRIRRKLLNEGHLKRYFIYAAGEILLVMIGILLALQVSNWNQSRINTIKEKFILEEFKANLEENLVGFKENIEWENNRITGAETILNYFDKKKPWDDSLNIVLTNLRIQEAIVISSSAYESLKSNGFDLISDEELRKSIIKLQETTYQRWEDVVDDLSNELLAVRVDFLT